MNFYELDAQMRKFEIYHSLKLPPKSWGIIRVDGRGFHSVLKNRERPFDNVIRDAMIHASGALIKRVPASYVYTQSDEISILFPRACDEFARGQEKLVSICASIAAVGFSMFTGMQVEFDGRLVACPNEETVVDYFRWRQADAARNALSAWAYWTLRKQGRGAVKATQELSGVDRAGKHDVLMRYGINFNALPEWQKRGVATYWVPKMKECQRPEGTVMALRRELVVNHELPIGDAYGEMILNLLANEHMQNKKQEEN